MSPTFTEDDVEKRVENAAGDAIGVVTAIEGETARVEPRAGVMDSIRSALGWRRTREGAVYVREDSVDEITDSVIRIEGEPVRSEAGAESTEEPSAGSREEGDAAGVEAEGDAGSVSDEAAEGTFDVGDADRERERTELETGDVEARETQREPGLGPAPDEGVGRREREPGNVAESGEPSGENADGAHELSAGADAETDRDADAETDRDVSAHEMSTGEVTDRDEDATERDLVEEMNRGDEVDEPPVDPTDGSETREESGSIPVAEEAVEPEEMDLLEDREHGVDDDAVDDVGDVAKMDTVDESEIDAAESESGVEPDARDGGGSEVQEGNESDVVAQGIDPESLEEAAETDDRAGSGTAASRERDAADELDVGTDPDALEEAVEADAEADEGVGPWPETESDAASDRRDRREPGADAGGVDPAEELDPFVDVEAAAEPGTGERSDEGPERTTRRGASDVAAERPDADPALEADVESWTDERPEETAGTPVDAAIDAQRTAIAEGQRAVTRGFRIQQEMAHIAIESQTELGCRTFEQFGSVTRAYVDALSSMAGIDANAGSTERSDETHERIRELETQLERQRDKLEDVRERLDEDNSG